jgi:hypothetical protein
MVVGFSGEIRGEGRVEKRGYYRSGRIKCLNDMATVWSEPSQRSEEIRTRYLREWHKGVTRV